MQRLTNIALRGSSRHVAFGPATRYNPIRLMSSIDDAEDRLKNATGESFTHEEAEEHVLLTAQDIAKILDPSDPIVLTDYHYSLLQEIDPELVKKRDTAKAIQFKVKGENPKMSGQRFKSADVRNYDRIAEWGRPLRPYKGIQNKGSFTIDQVKFRVRKKTCVFCRDPLEETLQINFTNLDLLHKFVNERGMISGRRVNGNCGPHQRAIAKAIKRARHLSLMSEVTKWKAEHVLE